MAANTSCPAITAQPVISCTDRRLTSTIMATRLYRVHLVLASSHTACSTSCCSSRNRTTHLESCKTRSRPGNVYAVSYESPSVRTVSTIYLSSSSKGTTRSKLIGSKETSLWLLLSRFPQLLSATKALFVSRSSKCLPVGDAALLSLLSFRQLYSPVPLRNGCATPRNMVIPSRIRS